MPVTKRASKIVSYNEQEEDDDFIPMVDNTKKNRINKSNESSKPVTKQLPRKHDEKLSKLEEKESKKPPESVTIEIDDTNSQLSVPSDDNQIPDTDDQDENLSPKNKRMKQDEEDDSDNKNEDEPTKKTARITDLPKRNSSVPLGFPTSKIHIPSPHISRVGLSRKSSTIKPLHPHFTSHVVHE